MRDFSINHHYDTALQLADYFDEQHKLLIYILYKRLQNGHICVHKDQVVCEISDGNIPKHLQPHSSDFVLRAKSKLIVESEGNFYLHRYYQYESKIIEKLRKMLASKDPDTSETGLPSLKDADGSVNWQSVAIIAALIHPFTIITGGPGTGKTTTVAKILNHLLSENAGLRIGLAAPTGKAAARMSESLQNAGNQFSEKIKGLFQTLEPLTIHRMLGPLRGSIYFRHNDENPLPLDVLIVDECSMIDMALFAKLMDAIGDNTRLILLGDRNQLASVEAGSLFGDLCEVAGTLNSFSPKMMKALSRLSDISTAIPEKSKQTSLSDHIVELQKSFRFSEERGIGRLSKAIVRGNESIIKDFISAADEEVIIDTQYESSVFENFVSRFEDYIREKDIAMAIKKFNYCKVLCAIRDGVHGLHNTNLRIEKVLGQKGLIQKQKDFYEHRPVMITKNNYTLQLYNGDTGIVRKDENGKLKVWFDINNKLVGFAPSMISESETAYAITIHKSQGSEFNEVLVLLPAIDLPLLTKELVYTAITRARNKVIIQSSETTLLIAVQKSVERGSGIKYRLK